MAEPVYSSIEFPDAPADRPYIFLNMVATIDGRITAGGRDQGVSKIGSKTDHATMHFLEEQADGMMIGAGNLRANPIINAPPKLKRFVVTGSGNVDPDHRFLREGSGTWLVMPGRKMDNAPDGLPVIATGGAEIVWPEVLQSIRRHGVERLLVEGGALLNGELLRLDLVDEIFFTLAPKIRLGEDEAFFAEGPGFPDGEMLRYTLVSCTPHEDEVFLRYRRHR